MSLQPDTVARVDELVARAQAEGRAPSLVAGIVRDGELVHVAGAGEFPAPDHNLQYRVGSISKTFTAALVMQLRDEGRLDLDEPLSRHLPGTPVGGVTPRQLLGHVSGLQREPEGDWWERSVGSDLDTLLRGLTPDKLAGPPYRGYHYSNLAYGLLGAVLTRITGEPWRNLLGKRLLGPLGLSRTTYSPEEPFARGYVVHPWQNTLREEPRYDAGAMAPAGQLWSTVADLTRWAAFLAAPDPAVLAPDTVAEMCAPVAMLDLDGWTAGHGLGLELGRRGDRVYAGHSGSMPGYLAILSFHRRSRTGVVAFANSFTLYGTSIGPLGMNLLDAVLDNEPVSVTPWRPGAVPPPEVEPLTGRWWWMGREYEACYDPVTQQLVMRSTMFPAAAPWRFVPESSDTWRCLSGMNAGELLRVRRASNGLVQALDIATFVFTRDPWPSL